jgi:hypothetical protein
MQWLYLKNHALPLNNVETVNPDLSYVGGSGG